MNVHAIPEILAISDSAAIGLAIIGVKGLITLGAIWKYAEVGPVLQIWGMMGTLIGLATGTMGTYFFTKEKVQQQESQIKMFQTALQASEKEKVEAGKQFWQVAVKIKPDIESPQHLQALEEAMQSAADLFRQIPVGRTEKPFCTRNLSRSALRLFEISRVLVGFDHVAGGIINPNHSMM